MIGGRAPALATLALMMTAGLVASCRRPEPTVATSTATSIPVAASPGDGPTLSAIKARGRLVCGVNTGLAGFAFPDNRGHWRGFDVDFCRATAAAVLGNADAVTFVPLSNADRLDALRSGRVDVLWRNTSQTLTRDAAFDFPGINYYDGQGFLVRSDLNLNSAGELRGARICVQGGSTTELNLADYFRARGLTYRAVTVASDAEARAAYAAESCDAYSADVSTLAAARATMVTPDEHRILGDVISKEPLGPVVRQGDDRWSDVVRWVLNALVLAEELQVTRDKASQMKEGSVDPDVRRLLGSEGHLGGLLGLDDDWAYRAIRAGGNYGEIFDRNLGMRTSLKLERGLNAQWNAARPGLMYAPPIR